MSFPHSIEIEFHATDTRMARVNIDHLEQDRFLEKSIEKYPEIFVTALDATFPSCPFLVSISHGGDRAIETLLQASPPRLAGAKKVDFLSPKPREGSSTLAGGSGAEVSVT